MAKVSLAFADDAPVVAAPTGVLGEVETHAMFNRQGDSIHLYLHRMAPDATVTFAGAPTDRALYVWSGSITAGGADLGPRSSAIVEHGASLAVTAGAEGATLLAFAAMDSDERRGGHVHLLPSERVPRRDLSEGSRVGMSLHADAQCPTCRLWLHENDFAGAEAETPIHSHTEDEIIFVRAGAIRLGNRLCGPGTALAIAANTKYGFSSGPEGLSFVNFRAAAPTYVPADGSKVLDEAALWHSVVGKPVYLAE